MDFANLIFNSNVHIVKMSSKIEFQMTRVMEKHTIIEALDK